LLEAAVSCLADEGYANLTTRRVAKRAGVSQGAWLHYFPTKSQFLIEAMRYAAEKIAADVLENIDPTALVDDPAQRERVLDEIWRVHTSPAFQAALELWIAARSDPELRDGLNRLERQVTGLIGGAAGEILPQIPSGTASGADLMVLIDLGLAAVRGFAMLPPVTPRKAVDRRWREAKRFLLAAYDAYQAGNLKAREE
jgi:AcrR family transcriptional regulator